MSRKPRLPPFFRTLYFLAALYAFIVGYAYARQGDLFMGTAGALVSLSLFVSARRG